MSAPRGVVVGEGQGAGAGVAAAARAIHLRGLALVGVAQAGGEVEPVGEMPVDGAETGQAVGLLGIGRKNAGACQGLRGHQQMQGRAGVGAGGDRKLFANQAAEYPVGEVGAEHGALAAVNVQTQVVEADHGVCIFELAIDAQLLAELPVTRADVPVDELKRGAVHTQGPVVPVAPRGQAGQLLAVGKVPLERRAQRVKPGFDAAGRVVVGDSIVGVGRGAAVLHVRIARAHRRSHWRDEREHAAVLVQRRVLGDQAAAQAGMRGP